MQRPFVGAALFLSDTWVTVDPVQSCIKYIQAALILENTIFITLKLN